MKKVTQYLYVYAFLGILFLGFFMNLSNLSAAVNKAVTEYSYEGWSTIINLEYNDNIWNRYAFVEGNGLVHRVLGQNRMNGIVRLKNGKVVTVTEATDITVQAQSVIQFNQWLQEREVDFLYVQAPYEVCDVDNQLPKGIMDYSNDNAGRFITCISEAGVPYMDLHEMMHEEGMDHYDAFFKTDHHWKIETAFWAFTKIVEYTEEIGVSVPAEYVSMESYSREKTEAVILGSNGRKTGYLYSGLDDMTILTPAFDTSVRLIVEEENINREGSFEEAYLFYERLSGDSIYETAQYDIYLGQDYGLCSLICETAPSDQKILIIKDSYARPVVTFMGTVYAQADVIDMRYYDGNVYEYVEQTQPDMVIVMYNPYMLNTVGNFDFNKETE